MGTNGVGEEGEDGDVEHVTSNTEAMLLDVGDDAMNSYVWIYSRLFKIDGEWR